MFGGWIRYVQGAMSFFVNIAKFSKRVKINTTNETKAAAAAAASIHFIHHDCSVSVGVFMCMVHAYVCVLPFCTIKIKTLESIIENTHASAHGVINIQDIPTFLAEHSDSIAFNNNKQYLYISPLFSRTFALDDTPPSPPSPNKIHYATPNE